MNIENIDERLLRTERERDEARAEVERVRESNEDSVAMVERLGAELARLRAAANERAITELSAFRGWAESDGDWSLEHGGVAYRKVVGRVIERIAALRAEQQAAPVPPAVEVFREAAKNCTGEMFGEAAAVKPKGQEFVFEGVMWVPAPGQKQDDIGRAFRHLTDFIGSRVTMRPVKPPADAPSQPSVEEFCEMSFRIDLDEIISIAKTSGSDCPTPLWMLEAAAEYLPKKRDALIAKTKAAFDALAGRGGAK